MADEGNEGEETSSRGQDWEVVSLTASAYEAVPGPSPKPPDLTEDDNDKVSSHDQESARAMFMSGHFVFPPNQHENLPLEPDNSEILNEPGSEAMESTQAFGLGVEEGERPAKAGEETWNIKALSEADELHGIQFFDGKGKSFSGHSKESEEGRALQELSLIEEEQSVFSASKYGSFHAEAELSGSAAHDETHVMPDLDDPAQPIMGASDPSKPEKATKEDEENESDLPCEAWWKRRAAALYSQAKEANTFWSVVVAAALMGLVILGQRWQQERWQIQQLKWKSGVMDEKINRIVGPVSRFKDILVGGHRRVIRSSAAAAEH